MTGPAWHPVGRSAEIEAGRLEVVEVAGHKLVIGRSPDGVFAMDDHCPHAGASLGEGMLDGGYVICPLHAFAYDVHDGRCDAGGPPAQVYPVREVDGTLEVELVPARPVIEVEL